MQCIVKIYKKSKEVTRQREVSHKPNCRIGSLFNYPGEDHGDEAARLAGPHCAFIIAGRESLNVLRLL